MIFNILFYIVGLVINILGGFFSVISFVVPTQVSDAIEFFFLHLYYFQGIVPVNSLVDALAVLVTFFGFFYGIKIALFMYSHLPFLGGQQQPFPTVTTSRSTTYNHMGKQIYTSVAVSRRKADKE